MMDWIMAFITIQLFIILKLAFSVIALKNKITELRSRLFKARAAHKDLSRQLKVARKNDHRDPVTGQFIKAED